MPTESKNPMCFICGEVPAVTTEGTCAFCDEKDEVASVNSSFTSTVRAKAITAMTLAKTRGR